MISSENTLYSSPCRRRSHSAMTLSAILLIIIGVYFGWASYTAEWVGDDEVYRFFVEGEANPIELEHPREIHTVVDVWQSQLMHYVYTNGRFTPHFLVQFFIGVAGKLWFAIFNALAWIAFILSIAKFSRPRCPISFFTLLSAAILAVGSMQTSMVPTCQISYVWMGVLVVLYLYIFLYVDKIKAWSIPLLLIFSLIVGNSMEAYTLPLSAAIFIYLVVNRGRWGRLQPWMALAFWLGAAAICLSPATLERAASESPSLSASMQNALFTFRSFYILAAIVIYKLARRRMNLREMYRLAPLLWNTLALMALMNLLIGIGTNRQLLGMELVSILLALRLLKGNCLNRTWTIVLGVAATAWLAEEGVVLQRQKEAFEVVGEKYAASPDGIVFADIPTMGMMIPYRYALPMEWPGETPTYHARTIQMYFADKYPGRRPLRILPPALEGRLDGDPGNLVLTSSYGSGDFICVQSKAKPARFIVKRRLLGIIPWSEREVDFSEPIFENEHFRVYNAKELRPFVYNTQVTPG